VFNEDACNEISRKAKDADGFVFGSPVYYGQPNGSLLSLVQRMLYSAGDNFRFKPVANVAVCRRGGASAAYQTMNLPFEMMNMPIVTSQYWNIGYGMVPGEVQKDEEGMQTMRQLARNMAWMLKKFHADGANDVPVSEQFTPTNFIR
jgi:multimeric flavodoxin WrbA